MVSIIHYTDQDLTARAFFNGSWASGFLASTLPAFRWAGLGGTTIDEDHVHVVQNILIHGQQVLPSPGELADLVLVTRLQVPGDLAPVHFAIPVSVTRVPDETDIDAEPDVEAHVVSFQDGSVLSVSIATRDTHFWVDMLRYLFNNPNSPFVSIDLADGGLFNRIAGSFSAASQSDGIALDFLGGSDTTNIVIHCTIGNHATEFVLKFYPRVGFNTTSLLSNSLASNGFVSAAKMILDCHYPEAMLSNLLGDDWQEISEACSARGWSPGKFFPCLHLFEFLRGNGDGGLPFWKSALEACSGAFQDEKSEAIRLLAEEMGRITRAFHVALASTSVTVQSSPIRGYEDGVADMMARLHQARSFISEIEQSFSLPVEDEQGSFFRLLSGIEEILNDYKLEDAIKVTGPEYASVPSQLIHQDLHMGQFMYDEDENRFYILDLEGDPQLPWKKRISPYPVERDVASLLRSLSYIKIAACQNAIDGIEPSIVIDREAFDVYSPLLFVSHLPAIPGPGIMTYLCKPESFERITGIVNNLNAWEKDVRGWILSGYYGSMFPPGDLLSFFTLQRILSEINYEIRFRPRKFFIPLVGLLEMLD